jgi:hypothetical protein
MYTYVYIHVSMCVYTHTVPALAKQEHIHILLQILKRVVVVYVMFLQKYVCMMIYICVYVYTLAY